MYQGRMWVMEVRIHTRTSGDYPSSLFVVVKHSLVPLKLPALEHIVRI